MRGKTLQHRILSITEFPDFTRVHAVSPTFANTPQVASQRCHEEAGQFRAMATQLGVSRGRFSFDVTPLRWDEHYAIAVPAMASDRVQSAIGATAERACI